MIECMNEWMGVAKKAKSHLKLVKLIIIINNNSLIFF